MFSGKVDNSSAYVDIQSGSGGTEAQDWAEMLMRICQDGVNREGSVQRLLKYPVAMLQESKVRQSFFRASLRMVG